MKKILFFLFIALVTSILAFSRGTMPGWVIVHPSNEASYQFNSHCIINAPVSTELFTELREWCGEQHAKNYPPAP